jgi:hypothetical protein
LRFGAAGKEGRIAGKGVIEGLLGRKYGLHCEIDGVATAICQKVSRLGAIIWKLTF